ncbi:hypothetical protein C8R42DRAFT_718886 [Lentinula raphanica]|nr:hypothetical protein C8R42DRAFT_718886 [Lentinula raphanica]
MMCLTNLSHDPQTLAPRTRSHSNVPSGSNQATPSTSDISSLPPTPISEDLDSLNPLALPSSPPSPSRTSSPPPSLSHCKRPPRLWQWQKLSPRVLNKPMWDIFDHGDLKDAIAKHVKINKITDLAEIKEVWAEAWHGYPTSYRWLKNTQKLVAMPLDEFINAVRDTFLGSLWPSKVADMRSKVHMKGTGAGAFADYVGEVQTLNVELKDTNYFYNDKQMLALIFPHGSHTSSTSSHPAPHSSAPSSSQRSHPASNQSGYNLVNEIAELAHRSKTHPNLKNGHRAGRLSDSDKRLLDLIEACYHCRTGWAGHRSTDPTCPGIQLKVPYRPPTMNMINKAIEIHKAKGCAITYNALLKAIPDAPAVSSVSSRPILDDISMFENIPSVPAAASVYSTPATASVSPYGTFPVSSIVQDTSLYLDSFSHAAHSMPASTTFAPAAPCSSKAVASLVPRKGRWSDFVEQELLISEGEEENIRVAHTADSARRRSLSESMSTGPSKR